MENQPSKPVKGLLLVLAILGWFALLAQFYINITSGIAPIPELLIRYVSYFTILTNLLVAVCCTSILLAPNSALARFFLRAKTLTAITVYILIVGLIYNLILRFLWLPVGLQKLVDELLHSVIPVMFLVFWFLYVVKSQLVWRDVFPWLIYPLTYVVLIFIRGSASGFYPYPFINVSSIGLEKALSNGVGIAFVFFVISLLFVALAKLITKKSVAGQSKS